MNKRINLPAAIAIVATSLLLGCHKTAKQSPPKTEPAHVEQHVDEQDLNRVTLTAQAEARLGIQLADTMLTEVQRRRTVGGEVMLPPGQTIMVSPGHCPSHPPAPYPFRATASKLVKRYSRSSRCSLPNATC